MESRVFGWDNRAPLDLLQVQRVDKSILEEMASLGGRDLGRLWGDVRCFAHWSAMGTSRYMYSLFILPNFRLLAWSSDASTAVYLWLRRSPFPETIWLF